MLQTYRYSLGLLTLSDHCSEKFFARVSKTDVARAKRVSHIVNTCRHFSIYLLKNQKQFGFWGFGEIFF